MKQQMKCLRCDENHPSCLSFHHRDPNTKEDIVSNMVCEAWSEKRILEEIAKCDVLCENCHRKLHWHAKLAL